MPTRDETDGKQASCARRHPLFGRKYEETEYSVTSIGDEVFYGCPRPDIDTRQTDHAPDCETTTFTRKTTQKNSTLYVPEEALEDYKTADVWEDLLHIEGCDFADAVGGCHRAPGS